MLYTALQNREVRLFPSHSIRDKEAELRAAAALLAIARAVPPFGKKIVSLAGGPKGRLSCYAEVPVPDYPGGSKSKGKRFDGVLRVAYGKTLWTGIVEAKVGGSLLDEEQVIRYVTWARENNVNAVITVSSQAALANGQPPGVKIHKALLKKVRLVHFSWERLYTEAQVLSNHKGVGDADQQWMLEEWIKYVADENSKIVARPQLGKHWGKVVRAAQMNDMKSCTSFAPEIATAWGAFLRKLALGLRANLGAEVGVKLSNKEKKDPTLRTKLLTDAILTRKELPGTLQIPGAAGDLNLSLQLSSKSITLRINVDAPNDRGAPARLTWMKQQLKRPDVPDDIIVVANLKQRKLWGRRTIADCRSDKNALRYNESGEKLKHDTDLVSFSLVWNRKLAKAKGTSTAPILAGIEQDVVHFYGRVIDGLKQFVPPPPQMPKERLIGSDPAVEPPPAPTPTSAREVERTPETNTEEESATR